MQLAGLQKHAEAFRSRSCDAFYLGKMCRSVHKQILPKIWVISRSCKQGAEPFASVPVHMNGVAGCGLPLQPPAVGSRTFLDGLHHFSLCHTSGPCACRHLFAAFLSKVIPGFCLDFAVQAGMPPLSARSKVDKMSGEVVDSNPYSRLMALQRMGIVKDYEKIREKTVRHCSLAKD